MSVHYLTVETAAEVLHVTERTVTSYISKNVIPHRKLPGIRRVLIPEDELAAYMDGAELEVVYPISGGRVVRPKEPPA